MKVLLKCKALGIKKEFVVKDLFDSIPIAKEYVKEAINKGIKEPRVSIYIPYDNVAWAIITKKDVREKVFQSATLTEFEVETLKKIVSSYKECGIENSDYYNVFGFEDKKTKGALGSLTRKGVVDRNNCPNCFNPIYPSHNFISTCEKYNIEISSLKALV